MSTRTVETIFIVNVHLGRTLPVRGGYVRGFYRETGLKIQPARGTGLDAAIKIDSLAIMGGSNWLGIQQ